MGASAMAQRKVVQDANGNYKVVSRDTAGTNKPTGKSFTDDKGVSHPVYISAKGKLYYMRTSRNGNVYKSYFTTD